MANSTTSKGLSREEVAAMREHLKELNDSKNPADRERAVTEKIESMDGSDRIICKRLHALIKANAPTLMPRLWYGMAAYCDKEGNVILFLQEKAKFGARYVTLGFNDGAKLDEGNMWPVSYAVIKFTPAEEAKVATLVRKAVARK